MVHSSTGPASFGYRRQDGRLVPDESEAPIRRRIFELFAEHQRKKTVAEILNAEGHRTRAGVLFTAQTITRLLTDENVKGISGEVEALVPEDLWERCNAILRSQKNTGGARRKVINLFSGYVYCACGPKMYVPSNTRKYICGDCRNKIASGDLEMIFRSQLKNLGSPNDGETAIGQLYERWPFLSFDDKRAVVEAVTNRLEVGDKKVTCFLFSL